MKYFALVAACITLTLEGRADAAKISTFKLDAGRMALLLTGTIEHGDGARFRAEASKYDKADVLLESDGGALSDALEIGEAIRLKGYATAVLNGSDCNSSCALIWLAGTPRKLSKSGRVGFHAAYTDHSGSAQESGVANAMVGRYLTLLNLPENAVIFATSAPPSKLAWLTTGNYAQSGINLDVIGDINWGQSAVAASPPPPPPIVMVTTPSGSPAKKPDTELWKRVGSWSVYVDPSLVNGCFLYTTYDDDTVLRIGVNRKAKDSYYLLFGNDKWTSLQVGNNYDVQIQLDNNSPWNASTVAKQMGDSTVLLSNFTSPVFWNEFIASTGIVITRNGKSVARLSIANTKAAFDELVACQKYGDSQTRAADPFAQ